MSGGGGACRGDGAWSGKGGRAGRRRARSALVAWALAALVLPAAGCVNSRVERVVWGPGPIAGLSAGDAVVAATESAPPAEPGVGLPGLPGLPVLEAKRGPLPARAAPMPWRRMVDGTDRLVVRYQERFACYAPLGFFVEYTATSVVLAAVAEDRRDSGTCPLDQPVPRLVEVRLPEAVGGRVLLAPPLAEEFTAVLDQPVVLPRHRWYSGRVRAR
ncbi:hypothetical protein [Saccharothrix sp. Mg75]|uniref:hypothetical protein n=1 Tax=Saccharothrix sp. Mg75 TaxID=3445357 RepID=UPI003EEF097F